MSELTNQAVKAMVVMRKAFRTIDTTVSETFKADGLTPTQFSVLDVLYSKGPMKIGELLESILATSGNMTVVIRNMEKKAGSRAPHHQNRGNLCRSHPSRTA